jgi:hypothetical protein
VVPQAGPTNSRDSDRWEQFCLIAKACEIVAERWTPLVLRELMCGSTRFGELHLSLRSMSRTLLSARLRQPRASQNSFSEFEFKPRISFYEGSFDAVTPRRLFAR